MKIQFRLNGKTVQADIQADMLLIDLLRDMGCTSVKRGCETDNCGLCTVWMDKKPILSLSLIHISTRSCSTIWTRPTWRRS